VQGLSVVGMFGMFFLGALYLQHVLGYDALQTGLAFLPATVVMAAWSLGYSEKLITRFGARRTLVPGLGLVLAGLLLLASAVLARRAGGPPVLRMPTAAELGDLHGLTHAGRGSTPGSPLRRRRR